MALANRLQIKRPFDAPTLIMSKKGNLNYLLISVLFVLPVILLILGVILFLNASPTLVLKKTEPSISISVDKRDLNLVKATPKRIAEKPNLMKQAGSLFNYVFDEGVFFKPSAARASRQFLMDRESKTVLLRVDYDVSPQNSISGIHFKTRNLDLSQLKHVSFSAKAGENKPLPVRFRIEFKNGSSSVRRFSVAPVAYEWNSYRFDFDVANPTDISEIVLVFEHEKVGPAATAGTVDFKNLTLE
jgi:hypothetical protein